MARAPELFEMAERHGLKVFTIEQLIHHRQQTEMLVRRVATTRLPTEYGDFTVHTYHTDVDTKVYIALVMGDVTTPEPVLVRVHSKCLTGDVFHSLKCDCGPQLDLAFRKVAEAGRGVLLYLEQEGRGIGIAAKMRAYELQDQGLETVEANHRLGYPADRRDYGLGCQVLKDLGLSQIRLMTNNPAKRVGIEGYGLEVVERVPLRVPPHHENRRYLDTKREKMGHLLDDFHAPGESQVPAESRDPADGNGRRPPDEGAGETPRSPEELAASGKPRVVEEIG